MRQFSWAALTVRQEAVWLLLPLLLAAALVVGGAVLKEPLVRDRGFRFALYGGCGLLFAVEVVRILVCWAPAAAYAATVSTAESVMISRYADLSAVAWPLGDGALDRPGGGGSGLAGVGHAGISARKRKIKLA